MQVLLEIGRNEIKTVSVEYRKSGVALIFLGFTADCFLGLCGASVYSVQRRIDIY